MGSGAYMNFGCLLLDGNTIDIGANALIGPNVHFYPPGAPLLSMPCEMVWEIDADSTE